ncbi:MAG: glycosyltransferase family 2 protein [Pseudomonadota bacterium]
MKVAAVVVTFNRKELLVETLRGVRNQTRPLDKILIIDNASTDGTREYLQANQIFEMANVEYIALPENTGGAGGFSHGMRLAAERGYDWIWTMDDDVEPVENCLETLLQYCDLSQCINSTKVFTDNDEIQYWEQYFDYATGRLVDLKNASFANGKPWCCVNVACFEGMLVSRELLNKISPPDPTYFIYHDDTVFGIKASFHTNVIYVRDAVLRKKIYGYGAVTKMRAYYMVRNTFRLKREVFATGLVGESSKFTNMLFFLNVCQLSISALLEKPRVEIFGSLARGWIDGIRGR